MKTFLKTLFFTLIFALMVQQSQARQWEGSIDFNLGSPQADFSEQLDRLGVGIGLTAGYQFSDSPFMLGFDFGFMNFGVDSRDEPLSSTIPDLTVRVENSYNLVNGNIALRAITQEASVRPFLEALVGFNYFYTQTTIRERGFGEEDVLRDTNFDDFALNYGFGGGAMFRVWQNSAMSSEPGSTPISSVYINVAGRYLFGNEAEYLQKGSIATENGQVTYDVSRSETDLLYFKLGVGFKF
ncbi:outer membrane beta-barrel protein [Rhodohalobacter mucosus]|uniref:Outer membrane protein beta-barrel domain-containing protein n=1 Tax=Rhodohalobacter mucosus TaxID=2079485 RepID=A0A316TT99_9BACT|nr:outer membrane beta-barrel protein [Rhodohalobacter mucosus]PWN06559.1 hypothetical protein DDZ15_08545 [Rhodohalobacter mucosus]